MKGLISTLKFQLVILGLLLAGISLHASLMPEEKNVDRNKIDKMAKAESYKESEKEIFQDCLVTKMAYYSRRRLVKMLSQQQKIILTFDDGPHPRTTPEILKILKDRNLKAIFFVLGLQVEKYPHLVKQIASEGHIIGNHSYDHKNFTKITQNQLIEQIQKTNRLIKNITGKNPRFLRPPYGAVNKNVLSLAQREEMNILQWSIDPRDWKYQNKHVILRNLANQLGLGSNNLRGGAILLHDIYPATVKALNPLLDLLAVNNYKITDIHHMESDKVNFWAAKSPGLMREGFIPGFLPFKLENLSANSLLLNMLKPRQKQALTSFELLKAKRNGNLLIALTKNQL
ncbi:MAG: polysaccharide deacetylase family protein [Candidatus Rifleibacteriota bacterium]